MPSSHPRGPITVLQVVPALDTGGAERTTIDMAAALSGRGDRALVASAGGRMEAELAAAGGELIRIPAASKNPIEMAVNAARIARIVRRGHVDIVHARSRAPAWAALVACRITGVPLVTTYHGVYGERNAAKRFYNSVMARGDVVIANSHYTAELVRERYGTQPERVAVIHRGTDLKRFDPATVGEDRRAALRAAWGLGGSERVVLNLARLTGWKGQRVLIEAAALPPLSGFPDLVIVLAGDDQGRSGYRRELEGLIEKSGGPGRIRLVGHCEDVAAALSLAAAAVVASTEPEAFGRAAVEAQAMGVPVVVTDHGAATETVLAPPDVAPSARTGWRVPPGDPNALAVALAEALTLSAPEHAALAARARTHASGFSVEAMQAATLAVYDRLLSRAGNNRRLPGPESPPIG
jgi:glycosyltransferase involved in cell wall biosynthesis